jgi:hypothetical protein
MNEGEYMDPHTIQKRHSIPDWLWFFLSGLIVGMLAASVIFGLPLIQQSPGSQTLPTVTVQAAATTEGTLPADATPSTDTTATAAAATQVEIQAIIAAGCQYLSNTTIDPQATIDLLTQHLSEITERDDLVEAYRCLAFAESLNNHFLIAAHYFDELYILEPDIEYLVMAASCYDNGGELETALEKYLLIIESDDPKAEQYRPQVQERAFEIQEMLRDLYTFTSPEPSASP